MKNIITAVILFIAINSAFSQVLDVDGNFYHNVTIGSQQWLAENLNVAHYRNGDIIPQVQDAEYWAILTSGAWCFYEAADSNGFVYGKLYNWYAVNDPRGIAPEGWHIPSEEEWNTLIALSGGERVAGKRLKSTDGWFENLHATNSFGFNALPGGYRDVNGAYSNITKFGYFWTATEYYSDFAKYHFMTYNFPEIINFESVKMRAMSVRCIKD